MTIMKNLGAVFVVVGFVLWFLIGLPLVGIPLLLVGAAFYFANRRTLDSDGT